MKKIIRAFIALPLPDEARLGLGQVNDALAAQMPPRSVRWVKPELMHVTLRFLGDTAVSHLPAITAELDRIAEQTPLFRLQISGLGCFPNRKRPRVIWAGLHGDLTIVRALKREIDTALEPLGWEPERRPFQAHLTLGRVRDSRKLRGVKWGVEVEEMTVPVTAVHLIESQLRPGGPIYTARHISVILPEV